MVASGYHIASEFRISPNHRVAGVAEELAERLQIAAVSEELAGEGAAEIVGGYAPSPDAGLLSTGLDDPHLLGPPESGILDSGSMVGAGSPRSLHDLSTPVPDGRGRGVEKSLRNRRVATSSPHMGGIDLAVDDWRKPGANLANGGASEAFRARFAPVAARHVSARSAPGFRQVPRCSHGPTSSTDMGAILEEPTYRKPTRTQQMPGPQGLSV